MATQRLHGLDFLRAIMMALGLVLHTAQIYLTLPAVDYYWDASRSVSMDVLLIVINTFRMPVFFLLSGFFTAMLLSTRGAQAMFKNRIQRLLWPFLVCLPALALTMSMLHIAAAHIMAEGVWGFDVSLVSDGAKLWDNTHNLWFLYYLLMHIATVWLLLWVFDRLQANRRDGLVSAMRNIPIYHPVLLAVLALGLSILGASESIGRISADLSFVPNFRVYLWFGLCFALGWWLWFRREDIVWFAQRSGRLLLSASVLLSIAFVAYYFQEQGQTQWYALTHGVLAVFTAASTVAYMLGFVGLFSGLYAAGNAWVRYFSDSAYWIFIFHSIPVVSIALLIHGWSVAAELKFAVVLVASTALCLITYQLWVRRTWLGKLLNGRIYDDVPWGRR